MMPPSGTIRCHGRSLSPSPGFIRPTPAAGSGAQPQQPSRGGRGTAPMATAMRSLADPGRLILREGGTSPTIPCRGLPLMARPQPPCGCRPRPVPPPGFDALTWTWNRAPLLLFLLLLLLEKLALCATEPSVQAAS